MSQLTPQQQKASELSNHILVTANAGSGKTKVLSGRYIDALLNQNIRVNEIAAITFTDKAASELYAKISEQIAKKYNDATDPKEKQKLNDLLKDLINSNISTFHSFCSSLLKEYPLEVGLDPSFTLLDKLATSDLINESTEEMIASSLGDPIFSSDLKKLIRLSRSTRAFKDSIGRMISERKKIRNYLSQFEGEPVPSAISKVTRESLIHFISVLFPTRDTLLGNIAQINSDIFPFIKSDNPEKIRVLLEEYAATSDYILKFDTLAAILDIFLTQKGEIRSSGYLNDKLRGKYDPDHLIEIQTTANYIRQILISESGGSSFHINVYAEYASLFFKYYKMTLDILTQKKKYLNAIDYEDMLILTAELLTKESVKKNLQSKFKFLMIDEYQDTNDLQFDIFIPLLDDLSAGNLYVVGDKKQSIYGFRDADLSVFDRTKAKIESNSGDSVVLEHTFRLTEELTAFVNKIFPVIFTQRNRAIDGDEEQFRKKRSLINAVDYEETVFFDINKEYKESNIALILNVEETEGKPNAARRLKKEAEMVAAHLAEHFAKITELNKTLKDKLTVAILTKNRASFSYLEDALSEAGIPYELMGGKHFFQQQVVQDISLVFKFITDPGNDFNLYSILRSPFFSISDEDILEVSQSEGFTAFDKLKFIIGDGKERLTLAYKTLQTLLEVSQGAKPHKIIDHMLSVTPYLAIVQKRLNGKRALANIKKLLSMAVEFENFVFNSIYDYNEYLDNLRAAEEDESQAPLQEDSNSVKIMTIHQAKGLEFTTVYLFACGQEQNKRGNKSDEAIVVHKNLGLSLKVSETEDIFNEKIPHIHYNLVKFLKKQVENEELKRLFYVAVTRAANNLFISGSITNEIIQKDSFLEMLVTALGMTNFPVEPFTIEAGPLKKATNKDGKQEETTLESFELTVSVLLKEHLPFKSLKINTQKDEVLNFEVAPARIEKVLSNEIITATKYLTFNQCPFKYYLNYISGVANIPDLSDLILPTENDSDEDNNPVEDAKIDSVENGVASSGACNFGAAIGTIIHDVLAKTRSDLSYREITKTSVENFINENQVFAQQTESLLAIINGKLDRFFKTDVAKDIFSNENADTEREIFVRKNNYFLMGVIDRLVILNDKIVIIDYKTDKDPQSSLMRYIDQLKYYACLCSMIFPSVKIFELRLIFINNPEIFEPIIIRRDEIALVAQEIEEFVLKLRSAISANSFEKNQNHCAHCKFSIDSKNCFV